MQTLIKSQNQPAALRRLVLTSALTVSLLCTTQASFADEYLPNVKRREVVTPAIDTENFEIGTFISILSVENFSPDLHFGLRAAYHINEDFFLEGSFGQTDLGSSATEEFILANPGAAPGFQSLEDRRYTDYHLSLAWNIFPGTAHYRKLRTMTSSLYAIGGVGLTNFADSNDLTINFGAGYRMLFNDTLSFRVEARDYLVSRDAAGPAGTDQQSNLAMSAGVSLLF